MREVFCNTSPLQYLHQLDLLSVLHTLAERIVVPPAVVHELATGRGRGINLPEIAGLDWIEVRLPRSLAAVPLVTDLGQGKRRCSRWRWKRMKRRVLLDDGLRGEWPRPWGSALKIRSGCCWMRNRPAYCRPWLRNWLGFMR